MLYEHGGDGLGIPEISDVDSGIAYAADMFTLALAGQRESMFALHGLKTKLNRLSPSGYNVLVYQSVRNIGRSMQITNMHLQSDGLINGLRLATCSPCSAGEGLLTHQALICKSCLSINVEYYSHVVYIVRGVEAADTDSRVFHTVSEVSGIE